MVPLLPTGLGIALVSACALGLAGAAEGFQGPGFAAVVSIAATLAPLAMLAVLAIELRAQDEPVSDNQIGSLLRVPFDETIPDELPGFMADLQAMGFASAGRMPALNSRPQHLLLTQRTGD